MFVQSVDQCDAVAMYPAPIELLETGKPAEIEQERDRLCRLWASLGFRQHNMSEVFWLDCSNDQVWQAIRDLRHLVDR